MKGERRCEYSRCRRGLVNPRKNQRVCNNRCRAAKWREDNLPRCPHCHKPIHVEITGGVGG